MLSQPLVEQRSACLSTATRVGLNVDHEHMNKYSDREGPYDEVRDCLQRIYTPLVDSDTPKEIEHHYVFVVKMNTPGFDLFDCFPVDSWGEAKGVMYLSMSGSGTSGCIMFQNKATRERFAVTLGVHNYAPWTDLATNFGDETAQEIRDSYYGRGKRNDSSASNGLRYKSKPLRTMRSAAVTFDEVPDRKRYPSEISVK